MGLRGIQGCGYAGWGGESRVGGSGPVLCSALYPPVKRLGAGAGWSFASTNARLLTIGLAN
jgi:hypothetical protein